MTLVSIVTPSLNQGLFLEKTLTSVLAQDYPNLEYLVVDGGSQDASVEIIQRFADRLAWWVSEPDAGQADAINKGMAHATGQIVAWLNSDDYYLPGTVSAAVRLLEANPDAAFVYGNTLAVDANADTMNAVKYPQVTLPDLLCFTIIGQPAVFIRREALDGAGGVDTRFHLLLDHQLWIRLMIHGRAIHLDEFWAASRFHSGAKNIARAELFGEEAFAILEWASKEPRLAAVLDTVHRRARASAHRVNARYLLDAGKPADSLGAWFRAFSIHVPTAVRRANLLIAALMDLGGLGALRRAFLRDRARRLRR